jgi:hypothetical protein
MVSVQYQLSINAIIIGPLIGETPRFRGLLTWFYRDYVVLIVSILLIDCKSSYYLFGMGVG